MSRLTHCLAAAALLTTVGASSAQASTLDRIERKVYRLGVAALDAVDATPSQRRAIQDIAARAALKLAPYEADAANIFRDAHRAWRWRLCGWTPSSCSIMPAPTVWTSWWKPPRCSHPPSAENWPEPPANMPRASSTK